MQRAFLAALLAGTAPAYAADIVARPYLQGSLISIDGEIKPGDFDVFKAKASPLSGRVVVFLHSPGGSLLVALQIGEFIRLRGWATIVPSECYSSCGFIWLAGTERMMPVKAKIGFHAASLNGQETGMGNALIGAYLNRLGLGYNAVAWATVASPDDIALLTPAKAKELGIDISVIEPDPPKQANAQPTAPPLQITPRPVTPQPVKPQQSDTAENEVLRVITQLYSGTQPNDAKMYTGMYFETTMYFGKMMPVYQIIAEKQKYFDRWPNRTYKMKSIEPVKCTGTDPQTECKVSGVVDFEASNQIKRSVGTATFEYTFRSWPDNWQERLGFKISAEGGKVLTRQVADVLKEQQGFEKPWPDAPAKPWQPSTAPAAGAILKVPPRW